MNKHQLYLIGTLALSCIKIPLIATENLLQAVQSNNKELTKELLKLSKCTQEEKGQALLAASKKPNPYCSAEEVRLEIIRMLITFGADINYSTSEKKTGLSDGSALFFAVEENYRERVKLLLECGADPNWKDLRGYTPLIRASINGNVNIAILLSQHGAHADEPSKTKSTALMFSAMRKYSALTRELLLRGAHLLPGQKINKYAKAFIEKNKEQAEQQRLSSLKKVLQTPDRLPDDLARLVLTFDGSNHLWYKYKQLNEAPVD